MIPFAVWADDLNSSVLIMVFLKGDFTCNGPRPMLCTLSAVSHLLFPVALWGRHPHLIHGETGYGTFLVTYRHTT